MSETRGSVVLTHGTSCVTRHRPGSRTTSGRSGTSCGKRSRFLAATQWEIGWRGFGQKFMGELIPLSHKFLAQKACGAACTA